MNKNIKRILYIIIALVILGLIAYPKIPKGGSEASEVAQPVSAQITVDAVILKKEELKNQVNTTGSLLADESVVLNAEVAGKIETISFTEGQKVKKGELLLKLNDEEILAEIEKLRFTVKLNEDNEFRQRQLLEKEAISSEEYETALTTLNTVRSEIKVLQARLEKHYIRAPFDGTVGLRNISEGGYLNPGTRVAELYKINPIKLEFTIPSKYIGVVNVGDRIDFSVDAYEQKFGGSIYAIEPQIDPQTRSIRLRAKADNTAGQLFPGQFARIDLTLEIIPDALLVPTEAVIPELNGKKVYQYQAGVVNSQQVTSGIRTENRLQILSGLNEGDTVITSGILQIGQGMEVKLNIK
ncbi:MAG: efflux RND transporter periplasmic adaptor subunit [Marinoscillum sp.]|uniref:efflux RND transporter periplasmic adaptor subunit n=1 Tax=Marinoscillum sp. TaxID=2024838 RepID=UPI00330532A5